MTGTRLAAPIGWEEAAAALLVAGFLGGATLRHQDHQDALQARAAIWLDVAERAEARWADQAEPTGEPLLSGYPTRDEWDGCIDQLRSPGCEGVRRAAVFFPGPDAGLDEFWYEGPGQQDAWAFEQPVTSRVGAHVRAGAVASILGSPRHDQPADEWTMRALQGQAELRERWAPEMPEMPFIEFTAGPPSESMTAFAERSARSGFIEQDAPVLAVLAAEIRLGRPAPNVADVPGMAGLLALELARAGRVQDAELVDQVAVFGPSATDRLAGLYARERLQRLR